MIPEFRNKKAKRFTGKKEKRRKEERRKREGRGRKREKKGGSRFEGREILFHGVL